MGTQELPAQPQIWEHFRDQMPVTANWAYFDHAAVAPLSGPAQQAIRQWADQAATQGDAVWPQWAQRVEQIRQTAAEIIQATPGEIALVPNTTFGINLVAEGLPWQSGDNLVTPVGEFPSNLYPWLGLQQRGVEVRRVPTGPRGEVDLDQLAQACDARTRLVAISWVGYASGYRIDVDRAVQMAHDQGALLMLDAIQGLGVFPIDVQRSQVDFLAADGHKWLLGPEGAGVFYVARRHLDLLRPMNLGWNSVVNAHDFSQTELRLKAEASRYEGGSQNMPGMLALGASIDLLVDCGLGPDRSDLADRVLEVTDQLCRRLSDWGASVFRCPESDRASGIVSFEVPGFSPGQVRQHLFAQRVVISCRGGRLRASAHAYNDSSDIDQLIEALSQLPATARV